MPRFAELKVLDLEYILRRALAPRPATDPRIVLVKYDDDTDIFIRDHYPTAWHFYGDLLKKLASAKPRIVFFDILLNFDSRVTAFGEDIAKIGDELGAKGKLTPEEKARFTALHDELNMEKELQDGLDAVPVLLPLTCTYNTIPLIGRDAEKEREKLEKSDAYPVSSAVPTAYYVHYFDYPHDQFFSHAVEVGQTCELYDADGVLRNDASVITTMRDSQRYLLPSIAVSLARHAMGLPREAIRFEPDAVVLGTLRIPIDADGRTLIGFTGPAGDLESRARQGAPAAYSARDVVTGAVPLSRFKDKVVLFGTTASGSRDVKPTPFADLSAATRMSGVEVVGTELDALLHAANGGPILHRARFMNRWGFLLTAALAVLAATLGATLPVRRVILLMVVEGPLLFAAAAALFVWKGLWIDCAFPILTAFASLLVAGIFRYTQDLKERAFLEQAFGKYLAPEMVKTLVASGESGLKLEGRPAELTILFADLRGFTSKSEAIESEEMVRLLNEHLTAMSEVILRHGGTLDKFIGDCVMAFWGAPIDDPEHALHACEAGLDMLETLARENRRRAAEGRQQLDIGVGICSGVVTVGNMGSIHRFDYTVIGDPVNTASRLEGATKELGYGAVIGERTQELLKGRLPTDALGGIKVKGKAAAVPVFGLAATRRADAGASLTTPAGRRGPAS